MWEDYKKELLGEDVFVDFFKNPDVQDADWDLAEAVEVTPEELAKMLEEYYDEFDWDEGISEYAADDSYDPWERKQDFLPELGYYDYESYPSYIGANKSLVDYLGELS